MYIITVVYMTQSERREAQVSCPVLIPELEQGRLIFFVYISEWLFGLPEGVFFCQAIHYHFNSAADICHAVPQGATFPATSVSPAGKALCPRLSATPWAAASTNSPLTATTPWMVSCILCSPLAFSDLFT